MAKSQNMEKTVNRISVTGHQHRSGISWGWVRSAIDQQLSCFPEIREAFSCLAIGADQVFAEAALDRNIPLTAVIPMPDYARFFANGDLDRYGQILARSRIIQLPGTEDDQASFNTANEWIVSACDVLLAVWDGEKAKGLGGTEDVVKYARHIGKGIVHINPITKIISHF